MAVFKREPLQLSIKLPQCRQEIDHLTSADRQAIIASCPCGAAQWLLHCASRGNANAQTNYANMLAAGKGVAQNHANALEWYRRAADLGHAKSMTKLGQLSRLDGVGRGARTTFCLAVKKPFAIANDNDSHLEY